MKPTRRQILTNLYDWSRGKTGSFSYLLFETIQKADAFNRAMLARVYPDEVFTLEEYNRRGETVFDALQMKWREKRVLRRVG